MRVIVGSLCLGLASVGAASEAIAQETVVAAQVSAEAQRVARGLEAQYLAALIRERRLADDRELSLIAEHEGQLRAARANADQRRAGAEAELERVRAEYAELVSNISLRDAASRAEIEAYRREAQDLTAQANAELLDAYQQFADGDQAGAYPIIAALTQAQVRARMAAAGAASATLVRQQARARELMRIGGASGATSEVSVVKSFGTDGGVI